MEKLERKNFNIEKFFIPLIFLFLFLGMVSGLARGGVLNLSSLVNKHFIIFFYGFFGGLLSLERAFGFSLKYLLVTPASISLGLILYIAFENPNFLIPGALLFILPNLLIFIKSITPFSFGFILSSILFIKGTVLFAFSNLHYQSALAFILFLIFYILSERAELVKIIGLGKKDIIFISFITFSSLVGLVVSIVDFKVGYRICFISLAIISLWFMRKDIARRTINMKGLAKFSAISVLSAYLWLFLGSFFIFSFGMWGEGIHNITLGFVFSMIFAHAPSIFPAMMKIKFQFSPILYIPLFLLNISVIIRNISYLAPQIKKSALVLNFFAIIAFFVLFLTLTIKASKKSKISPQSF